MDRIGNAYRTTVRKMNKRFLGKKGTYTVRQFSGTDTATGIVDTSGSTVNIMAQPMPLSVREMIRFTEAGYRNIEARWAIQQQEVPDVKPGDLMTVTGFTYQVLAEPPPMLDEFGISWIAYTRRVHI